MADLATESPPSAIQAGTSIYTDENDLKEDLENYGGLVSLLFNDHDAQRITNASYAAPIGQGEETLVDMSIRETWELSPENFEIRNPAWIPFLNTVVAKVSTGMGVDATGKSASAELYKTMAIRTLISES
ncbi:uncharacterized protein PAC_05563 [Phialocephala subalpina]|uniref:Uncharacterized protein n=1 Tax=Phialocephala subalpina TaxID=576137 RepID=A0A1L7WSE3_9HELO|nr:uncharacterized protein PAC_05563 [Phialocephala subalpina]